MGSALYSGNSCIELTTQEWHSAPRGGHYISRLHPMSLQSLSTDPVGTTTVTFSGVNANSEIRVYLPDTTEVAGVELCSANHALTWSVYAGGSPNNTVRIVIVHPDYKIKEFMYTVALGNQSLPVQQELDKWYNNP
jgi:hypothetical protein